MNTQNQKSLYPRGSEWRRWDLHIHTPASYINGFGGWVSYIKKLNDVTKQKDIRALGVTDYFSIDGYKAIITEYKNSLKNIELILPNIEFRLDNIVYRRGIKKPKRLNFHVIFSNEVDIGDIETQFLGDLHFYKGSGNAGELSKIKLEKKAIEKYGKECKKQKEFESDSDLTAGAKNIVFKLDEIVNSLKNKPEYFKGKYLLFLESEFWSDIDWGQDYGLRKTLLEVSHGVFDSNPNDIKWFLGLDRNSYQKQQAFIDEFGRLFPSIHGTDAHTEQELEQRPEQNRFCWIKADLTFEGLKQILYEPELRVKIQQEDPRENETYTRVEKCIINFPSLLKIQTEESGKKTDFCLQDKYELEFSNNLTCIIGGRGSGKSTLVHLLYNVWSKKDIVKLDELNSPLLSLDLIPDPLKQVAELTTTEIPADTEFFLQNEIEKFARDVDEMSGLIRHRLLRFSFSDNQIPLKDLENEWSEASHSMDELIEAYDSISTATQNIELIKKQIGILKKQTAVIKSKEYKDFQREIEDINDKISALKRYKSEYTQIVTEIDALITTTSQLNWNEEQGKDTLTKLMGSLRDYKEKLKQAFSLSESKFEANKYSEQFAAKKLQLKKYLVEKGLAEENIEELADVSEQIKELEDEIRSLERQKAPFEEIYSKRDSILSEYKEKCSVYHDRFFEVAVRLQKELEGLPFFDKEISFTPKINEQRLREAAVEFVKQSSPTKVTLRTDDIQTVLFDVNSITEYLEDKNKIQTCVNQSDKTFLHKQVLQELVNNPVFLEKLYFRLWRDYYDIGNIQVQTKLGDKLLQNTSFGERCGIVMSIVLVAGTNPIVIDQPEDNLDGKFISNVLVPLLRKRKLSRQILLVTRDANIVIGGDAELIHILESDENGKKTKVAPSSIENIEYREKYIWILDGGKEAFLKREQKYSI